MTCADDRTATALVCPTSPAPAAPSPPPASTPPSPSPPGSPLAPGADGGRLYAFRYPATVVPIVAADEPKDESGSLNTTESTPTKEGASGKQPEDAEEGEAWCLVKIGKADPRKGTGKGSAALVAPNVGRRAIEEEIVPLSQFHPSGWFEAGAPGTQDWLQAHKRGRSWVWRDGDAELIDAIRSWRPETEEVDDEEETPVKKPRGRPRKHPLPAPAQAAVEPPVDAGCLAPEDLFMLLLRAASNDEKVLQAAAGQQISDMATEGSGISGKSNGSSSPGRATRCCVKQALCGSVVASGSDKAEALMASCSATALQPARRAKAMYSRCCGRERWTSRR